MRNVFFYLWLCACAVQVHSFEFVGVKPKTNVEVEQEAVDLRGAVQTGAFQGAAYFTAQSGAVQFTAKQPLVSSKISAPVTFQSGAMTGTATATFTGTVQPKSVYVEKGVELNVAEGAVTVNVNAKLLGDAVTNALVKPLQDVYDNRHYYELGGFGIILLLTLLFWRLTSRLKQEIVDQKQAMIDHLKSQLTLSK